MTHALLSYAYLRTIGRNIRLHGNRFVQVDLDADGLERLHLWHEGLVPLAQAAPTFFHDHVFNYRSQVLAGVLVNQPAIVYPDPKGTHHVYEGRRRDQQDTELVHVDARCHHVALQAPQVYRARAIYFHPAELFHASAALGYAVTHFRRELLRQPRAHPRVLVPVGMPPDNAFNRYAHGDQLWDVVARAYAQLPECRA